MNNHGRTKHIGLYYKHRSIINKRRNRKPHVPQDPEVKANGWKSPEARIRSSNVEV